MGDTKPLAGFKVAIVASDGFEEAELFEPRKALEALGAKTEIVSSKDGSLQAFHHDEKTRRVAVDRPLASARPDDYDGVVLPGGAANAETSRIDEGVLRFVKAMAAARKPVAFICHAPWIVISAGLAAGRKMTSYKSIRDDCRNAGADWSDEAVVVDGNFVSSREPKDLPAFNREMIKLLVASRAKEKVS